MIDAPTSEDIDMIEYFFFNYADIENWCDWETKKPMFEKYYPELIEAMTAKKFADNALRAIVNGVINERV